MTKPFEVGDKVVMAGYPELEAEIIATDLGGTYCVAYKYKQEDGFWEILKVQEKGSRSVYPNHPHDISHKPETRVVYWQVWKERGQDFSGCIFFDEKPEPAQSDVVLRITYEGDKIVKRELVED